jgi:acyl-CoA synthetase (NDP forming)
VTRSAADLLFRPRSVVVYGASTDPNKLSGRPLDYLKKFNYAGALSAVNPNREVVQGIPSYRSIDEVPGPIDLVIIVVPADSVAEAVERCAEMGAGAAIVFASGFAEGGGDGVERQNAIAAAAAKAGMRLLGPNCLGSFAAQTRAFATFSTAFDDGSERPESPIALVTQSGAVGTFTYTLMNSLGLGVRYFANTGNQADLTVVEILTALASEPDVELLLGHMEDFTDVDSFRQLAETAAHHDKPLIILKAGRSSAGSRAVAAHTGSVAGDDTVFNDLLREHGVVRVESMEGMADAALAFVGQKRAKGTRLTIVTLSGGAGALAADAAIELGLMIEPWDDSSRREVAAHLPYFASTENPIDLTGSMINNVNLLRMTLAVVEESESTDVTLVVLGNAERESDAIVDAIVACHEVTSKPLVVSWTGGSGRPRERLLAAGVPTYADPSRAVRALAQAAQYGRRGTQP